MDGSVVSPVALCVAAWWAFSLGSILNGLAATDSVSSFWPLTPSAAPCGLLSGGFAAFCVARRVCGCGVSASPGGYAGGDEHCGKSDAPCPPGLIVFADEDFDEEFLVREPALERRELSPLGRQRVRFG
jgi:hypothetical protein